MDLVTLPKGDVLTESAARRTKEPRYEVIHAAGAMEIREYAPMIVAEVEVAGDMAVAGNRGFQPLAGYIFGDNRRVDGDASATIAMTAPVIQERSQSIAMTAPVMQGGDRNDRWRVAFVMPEEWTLETLPAPTNPGVHLRAIQPRRMAVIRFSGGASESRFRQKASQLMAFLAERGMEPVGNPVYARYDPPRVPAPFRRNEVMIEIAAHHTAA